MDGAIAKRSGDRIKTDQRDARNLSKYFGPGLNVSSNSEPYATADESLHQSKMRVIHFLHGHCYTTGSDWTKRFKTWINQIELERQVCTTRTLERSRTASPSSIKVRAAIPTKFKTSHHSALWGLLLNVSFVNYFAEFSSEEHILAL